MKAAVLVSPGRFDVTEVAVPDVGPDEVLIKVDRCGVCGTDVHIFNGHYSADKLPLVPGHELAGTVVDTGRDVSGPAIGGKAVVDINFGCGSCFYCRRNEVLNCQQVSQLGIGQDGAFAEYVSVPNRHVIAAPDDMSFETLALTEPLACVVRATKKAHVGIGQSVVVLGAGPIGNLHIQVLRLAGAAPVIVLETNERRANLALKAGADAVAADAEQLKLIVRELTDGRGADVVVECVGLADLYRLAFDIIRPGGHVSAFGLAGETERLALPLLDTVLKENSFKGSVAGMGQDMHDALGLLRHGRIHTDAFVRDLVRLGDIQDAFEQGSSNAEQLKTTIVMNEQAG
jgi:2-desacetyl-2-hydroxyethyl bacteriochlorophyllide A dehydrogenase